MADQIDNTQAPVQQQADQFGAVQTTPLLDIQKNAVINVPFDDANDLLKTGNYQPPAGKPVSMIAPDGSAVTVPPEKAFQAIHDGMRLETTQEQHERIVNRDYGSAPQAAAAGLAGAARGLSFGLSDQLAARTGMVAPKTLEGLKEANPISSNVGEFGAILGDAALTGGASLLGTGARETANLAGAGLRGVSDVGHAAEAYVAKQAGKLGMKQSIVNTLSKGAGSAVEGAFYGAGNLISENALGEADFNAESLAANVGMGALIGGALGGGVSALSELGKPVVDALSPIAEKIKSKIVQEPDINVQGAKLLGMTASDYRKFQARNPGLSNQIGDFVRQDLKLGVFDSPESLLQKLEENQVKAGEQMNSVYSAVDKAVETNPELAVKKSDFYGDVLAKVDDLRSKISQAPTAELNGDLSKIDKFIDVLKKGSQDESPLNASALREIRQSQDALLNYNKAPGQFTIGDELGYIARTSLKEQIDGLATKVENSGLADSGFAQQLRDANRAYYAASTFSPFLEKAVAKDSFKSFSLSNPLKFLDSLKNTTLDITRKLSVMGKLESSRMIMDKALSSTVRSMFDTAQFVNRKAVPVLATALSDNPLTHDYATGKGKKPANDAEAFQNLTQNIQRLESNPSLTGDKLASQSDYIASPAPNTAAQLNSTSMAALLFLSSKLPRKAAQPDVVSMLNPKAQPVSKVKAAEFKQYLSVINDPKHALMNLQNGTATRHEMDALRNVYPAIYKNLQNRAMQNLQKHGVKLNYNQRIKIGMLLNVPTDQSLIPQNVLALQASFGDQPQQSQGNQPAVNPTVGGAKALNVASRTRTGTQELRANGAGGEDA